MHEISIAIVLAISYFFLFLSIFYLLTFFLEKKRAPRKKFKKLPKISALIPAHNEEKNIRGIIKSLLNSGYPKNKLEIIVVDDGSEDNTYKVAKEFGAKAFRKRREGKASALNFGIKKCKGDFVLTIDADCQLTKGCLSKMLNYFTNSQIGAVVPTLKVYGQNNFLVKFQAIEYVVSNFLRRVLWFMSSLHILPGAPMYRKAILTGRKFDESTPTEDLEMGLRTKALGFDIPHATEAVVYTKAPHTLSSFIRQRIRWTYGIFQNFKKYSFLFTFKNELGFFILPSILLGCVLLSFLFLFMIASLIYNLAYSFYLWSLINYDVRTVTMISNFINADILFDPIFYVSSAGFVMMLLIYYLAIRELKEKPSLYFLPFIFAYGILLAFCTFLGAACYLFRKKPKSYW